MVGSDLLHAFGRWSPDLGVVRSLGLLDRELSNHGRCPQSGVSTELGAVRGPWQLHADLLGPHGQFARCCPSALGAARATPPPGLMRRRSTFGAGGRQGVRDDGLALSTTEVAGADLDPAAPPESWFAPAASAVELGGGRPVLKESGELGPPWRPRSRHPANLVVGVLGSGDPAGLAEVLNGCGVQLAAGLLADDGAAGENIDTGPAWTCGGLPKPGKPSRPGR